MHSRETHQLAPILRRHKTCLSANRRFGKPLLAESNRRVSRRDDNNVRLCQSRPNHLFVSHQLWMDLMDMREPLFWDTNRNAPNIPPDLQLGLIFFERADIPFGKAELARLQKPAHNLAGAR